MRLALKIMPLLLLFISFAGCPMEPADPLASLTDPAAKFAYGITNTQTYYGGVIRSYSVSRNGVVPVDSLSIPVLTTGITAYPSKNALYVMCCTTTEGYIYQYKVGPNGTLSAMSVPSVLFAEYPLKLVIHPSGNYAYMLDSHNYGIGADVRPCDGSGRQVFLRQRLGREQRTAIYHRCDRRIDRHESGST
ncbi:MAG: hypothetical protein EHM28_02305 [Spirochaetaceae bacterium]|nr:MAG: hypothetical protein EHM28_02305 [Spirochaetaceae bacterium]